jgi:hypothetical protein
VTADGPSNQVCARVNLGDRVFRTGDGDDPIFQEGQAAHRLVEAGGSGPDGHVNRPTQQQTGEVARVVHAQFDVKVIGAAGEQIDQAGRGMLGKQAGRGDPQQPPPSACLADLEDRLILKSEHFRSAAGQS